MTASTRGGRLAAALFVWLVASTPHRVAVAQGQPAQAQIAQASSRGSRGSCDSLVAAAGVDSVDAGLFIRARRSDAYLLGPEQARALELDIGAAFIPPRPFQLSVFAGPARMHALRPVGGESRPDLRAPTVTGVYRISSDRTGAVRRIEVVRDALAGGFDSAAVAAIRDIGSIPSLFVPSALTDSMQVDVRFSTDSVDGALRIMSARFPRMPVVDAMPRADNPAPPFPEDALADSLASGEVVLRLVVDRTGAPIMSAIEVVRATAPSFMRAAVRALPTQRFVPETVAGCAVAEMIDYSLSIHSSPPL